MSLQRCSAEHKQAAAGGQHQSCCDWLASFRLAMRASAAAAAAARRRAWSSAARCSALLCNLPPAPLHVVGLQSVAEAGRHPSMAALPGCASRRLLEGLDRSGTGCRQTPHSSGIIAGKPELAPARWQPRNSAHLLACSAAWVAAALTSACAAALAAAAAAS